MDTTSAFTSEKWLLSFRLKRPKPKEHDNNGHESEQPWWSYDLYRGPRNQKPRLFYARSRAESEEIAEEFSQEKVLGFDMEWPSYDATNSKEGRLQDKIGVIAIACEDKIALFHLGAYVGKKPSDFIGPVLRTLIESPDVVKAGVNILAADFRRLQDHFGLQPQGAVELSHLHNLVTHGTAGEFSACTTKLCALDEQVQTHLGLPLKKSRVRTSNWSQRKQLSREQKSYAASDAYAGFMLYHRLNHLRFSMDPTPPPPLYAERYRWIDMPRRGTALLLQLDDPDNRSCLNVIRAVDFFEGRREATYTVKIAPRTIRAGNSDLEEDRDSSPPDSSSQGTSNVLSGPRRFGRFAPPSRKTKTTNKQPKSLLHKLKTHREKIAKQRRLETWKIIHNSALELVAKHRPDSELALMQLKGIGPQTVKKYGAAILNIVAIHAEQEKTSVAAKQTDNESSGDDVDRNETVSGVEGPGDTREVLRSPSPDSGTQAFHAVHRTMPGTGSRSDPIEFGDSADIVSAKTSSQPALKRKRTPSVSFHTDHIRRVPAAISCIVSKTDMPSVTCRGHATACSSILESTKTAKGRPSYPSHETMVESVIHLN